MPYCSSEGKFAGFEDEPEVEIESEDCDEDAARFEVSVHRLCASCGDDSTQTYLELEAPFNHECEDLDDSTPLPEMCHQWSRGCSTYRPYSAGRRGF